MPRYPHYIRPAKGGRWPQRVLAVECESTISVPVSGPVRQTELLSRWRCATMLLGGDCYQVASYTTGGTRASWWDWLADQLDDTRSTWILSEGCGRIWPLIGLWQEIEQGRVRVIGTDPYDAERARADRAAVRATQRDPLAPVSSGERRRAATAVSGMLVCADPPCIATLRVDGRACSVTWIDARNYGVHLPAHCARGTDTIRWLCAYWRQYHDLMRGLMMGSAQCTTGSQALHGWRVSYYHGGVYAGGTAEMTALEQSALMGGRCECYRIGEIEGPVYHLDIRSAYASQCVRESVPIRLSRVLRDVPDYDLGLSLALHQCIASVRIRTDERAYPYRRLPSGVADSPSPSGGRTTADIRGGTDIVYPVGQYDTVLCGPELADAYRHGRVLRCYTLHEYDAAPILRDYARAVYSARCEAERLMMPDMAAVCKRLLVSIVGKFGQHDRRWLNCPTMWSPVLYGEWYGVDEVGRGCRYRSLGGVVQRDTYLGLCSEAVPSVAAWILSAARRELLRLIRIAGWEHTYYCDTDSLMVSHDGFMRLCEAQEPQIGQLGRLYVQSVYTQVAIRGSKWYVADGRTICSGLPRGRCTDVGDGVHFWYSNHAEADAAHGVRPGAVRTMRKYVRSAEYRGGVVRSDGRVDPIMME
jgi:DNA polymerase type B, organellar and viral